jgi:hypothetical protein
MCSIFDGKMVLLRMVGCFGHKKERRISGRHTHFPG